MKKQKDPLEEIRNANKGKETEIRKAIKKALKWKKLNKYNDKLPSKKLQHTK